MPRDSTASAPSCTSSCSRESCRRARTGDQVLACVLAVHVGAADRVVALRRGSSAGFLVLLCPPPRGAPGLPPPRPDLPPRPRAAPRGRRRPPAELAPGGAGGGG